MKELIFLSVAPDDLYYSWQYEIFIENIRKQGYLNEIRILLFLPKERDDLGFNPIWNTLEERYKDKNVKFFRYRDSGDTNLSEVSRAIEYTQLLRPYVLAKHFDENPDLKNKAIFYHDSDIVFTKYLDLTKYLNDDIQYMSNTGHYMNVKNFFESDNMYNRALPHKKEELKSSNFLDLLCKMNGISRDICLQNENNTGGAQYILKNIDGDYWRDVYKSCIIIRSFLSFNTNGINKQYFADENAGYQSWCADMWAVLWNLWKRGHQTRTPKELDFAWATDGISRWNELSIYHDAGAGPNTNLFHKREERYIKNISTPFDDDLSFVDKTMCSYNYVKEILEVKNKYYSNSLFIQHVDTIIPEFTITTTDTVKREIKNYQEIMRWDVINKFIQERGYTSYLEIGYYKGWSFDNIKCNSKIAVDPNPSKNSQQEQSPYGKTLVNISSSGIDKIIKLTSNDFFERNTKKYDIIFIDGLHEAKQVEQDILNSLKVLNDGGVIILHDCNPPELEYTLGGVNGCWNGDVYKTIMAFKLMNPSCYTIDTDWGIGVIEKFDIEDNIEIINELGWEDFSNNRESSIGLISTYEFIKTKI